LALLQTDHNNYTQVDIKAIIVLFLLPAGLGGLNLKDQHYN